MTAALTTPLLACGLLTTEATAESPPGTPRHYLTQAIDWKPCFTEVPAEAPPGAERLECGSYKAPLDWHRPHDPTDITIAVSRLKPADSRTTVLTNPGGPGASGRMLPLMFLAGNRTRLTDNAEIIGIDVRGTGDSTKASCGGLTYPFHLDPRDRGRANVDAVHDAMAEYARTCQEKSGALGRAITTEQTVRDLDLLRHLLGRRKVSWVGYSGGTWLGAHYATAFPHRVERFVLDSNAEFTAPWQQVFSVFGAAGERRFRVDLAPWLGRHDSLYHLGSDGEQVRRTYERVRSKLVERPVVLPDGTVVTATQFDLGLFNSLYAKASWPETGRQFARLVALVDQPPTAAATTAAAVDPVADATEGTLMNILCNDTPFRGDARSLAREAERDGTRYPLFGWYRLAGPCAFWDRPDDVRLPTPTGRGVPPVLMVQSVRDPATPLEGARRAHERFAGSRLLTVTDEGDHGIYGGDNACVNDVVESYLVDGVVPPGDLSCAGMPLPEPAARTAAVPNPLREVERLTKVIGPLPG